MGAMDGESEDALALSRGEAAFRRLFRRRGMWGGQHRAQCAIRLRRRVDARDGARMTRRRAGRARNGAQEREGSKGFALVTVIWGLAIITLLVISYQSTARLRLQTAFNLAGAAQADLAADAGINLALMSLLAERQAGIVAQRPAHDGAPNFCAIDAAAVAIALEDEGGKVNLNAASQNLLKAMLEGFGVDPREAEAVAGAIVAFRSPPGTQLGAAKADAGPSNDLPPPKNALYQSIFELDQTWGVSPALLRRVAPFVTVSSRSPTVDPRSAPPALFAALAGRPPDEVSNYVATPFPNNLDRKQRVNTAFFGQTGEAGAVLAHVEAILPTGQTSVREALLDFEAVGRGGYAIKELRRGRPRHLSKLRDWIGGGGAAPLPNCE